MGLFTSSRAEDAALRAAVRAAGGAAAPAVDPVMATRAAMLRSAGALSPAARAGVAGLAGGLLLEALNPSKETQAEVAQRAQATRDAFNRHPLEGAATYLRQGVGLGLSLGNRVAVQPVLRGAGALVRGAFGLEPPDAPLSSAPTKKPNAILPEQESAFRRYMEGRGEAAAKSGGAAPSARAQQVAPTEPDVMIGRYTRAQANEILRGLPGRAQAQLLATMLTTGGNVRSPTGQDMRYSLLASRADQAMRFLDAQLAANRITPEQHQSRVRSLLRDLAGIGTPTIADYMQDEPER